MERPGIISVTLADIYFQQGYIEKSMEIYKELMKKEPHNDVYKKRLATLKKDLKAKQKMSGFKNR
jgi:regulator of sirC expression with transglutaminase-like and TPR domain